VQLNRRKAQAGQALLDRHAVAAYQTGGMASVSALLSNDLADIAERLELVDQVAARQTAEVDEAQAAIAAHAEAALALDRLQSERQALLSSRQTAMKALDERFREARALTTRLRRERANTPQVKATADAGSAPAASSGGVACPMAEPYSFIDSWGASRSGGRSHKGTDIMAAYGTTVYAITNGVISRTRSGGGLGGIALYLQGDNGIEYYYAHMASLSVREGQRVRAGAVVATNGATGNAAGGPPHVHFEVHPGGSSPVNPYPYVKAACG
jgi:murein DD-endopeptidase MepM/ murein hydrolase activator NlpD